MCHRDTFIIFHIVHNINKKTSQSINALRSLNNVDNQLKLNIDEATQLTKLVVCDYLK